MAWGGLIPVNSGGSGGATTITIEEGDVSAVALVSTLDFDTNAFNITGPSPEANVALNFGEGTGQPVQGTAFADHSSRHETGGSDPLGGTIESVALMRVLQSGVVQGEQHGVNVVPGANLSSVFIDDPANSRVNWFLDAIASGGGGGGGIPASDTIINVLSDAINLTGVMSNPAGVLGCAVTAQGTPDTTVTVAGGDLRYLGRPYRVVAATSPAMPANGSNPMYYVVSRNPATGVITATAGTPAATPSLPTYPTADVALAAVYRATSDTTIVAGDITDLRQKVEKPTRLDVVDWYGYVPSTANDIGPLVQEAFDDCKIFGIIDVYLRGDRGTLYWGRTMGGPAVMPLGVGLIGDGGHTRSNPGSFYVGTEVVTIAGTNGPILISYTQDTGFVNGGGDYAHGLRLKGIRFHGRQNLPGAPQWHAGGNMIELATLGEVHDVDDISVYTASGHGIFIKESRTNINGIVSSTPLDLGHLSFHSCGQGNTLGTAGDGSGLCLQNQWGTAINIRYIAGDNNTQALLTVRDMFTGTCTVQTLKAERSVTAGHPCVVLLRNYLGGTFNVSGSMRVRSLASIGGGQAWILSTPSTAGTPSIKLPAGIQAGEGGELYTWAIQAENTSQQRNITPTQLTHLSYFGRGLIADGYSAGGVPGLTLGADTEFHYGAVNPESSVTANPSSVYFRTTDSAAAQLYVKRTGTGNTGWVAIMQYYTGAATPEAAVTAPVGAMYVRTTDAAPATLYVKRTGTGNTGWVPLIGAQVGTLAYTPPTIPLALGSNISTTVTVTGAAIGNPVSVGFSQTVPAGVLLHGDVTASGTVTVKFFNFSGVSQTLGAGTLNVFVQKAGA